MEPEFSDRDLVMVAAADRDSIVVGDVIVARHPFKNVDVIKYVESMDPDGYVVLRSPQGDDSRQFGRIAAHTIKGRVGTNLTRTFGRR